MTPHKRLLQQKPDPRRSRDGAWERLGGTADEQLWAERKAARLKDLLRCKATTAPRFMGEPPSWQARRSRAQISTIPGILCT
jgi:hypothetical protein